MIFQNLFNLPGESIPWYELYEFIKSERTDHTYQTIILGFFAILLKIGICGRDFGIPYMKTFLSLFNFVQTKKIITLMCIRASSQKLAFACLYFRINSYQKHKENGPQG